MDITSVKQIEDYNVIQREDGRINASEFLNRYNAIAKVKKRLDVFLRASETKEIIELIKDEAPCKLEKEKQEGYRPMKRTWWFSPTMFVYFAMWLDARITLTFASEIAKSFKSMWDIYSRVVDNIGISGDESKCEKLITAIDYVVFGRHEPNMWLNASVEQRAELRKILGDCMRESEDGMNYDTCIDNMRKIYSNKHKNDI